MNSKKVLAVILSLIAFFSLTACKGNEEAEVTQESTTVVNNGVNETVVGSALNTEIAIPETTPGNIVQESSAPQVSEETVAPTQSEETTTEPFDDPANWSEKRIIQEYKKAAKKSNATAKSKQQITLKGISVNNGEYDKAFSLITPIIGKFLESNSTEKTGITGGFENLVPEDISSAKAYKEGENTVIEMTMVEQTSGPKEDALSGSVGHAITAVGDISEVVNDLAGRGLPLELSEEETNIYYTNPVVKVVINENGEIISGSWSYMVEIRMNNFKAFGQNVEKASIIMDNTITV